MTGYNYFLKFFQFALLAFCLSFFNVHAEDDEDGDMVLDLSNLHDFKKLSGSLERLTPLGNDLMGDMIDPKTGSIVFSHTDVTLPTNSGLDVSLQRRIGQGPSRETFLQHGFSDWTLDLPVAYGAYGIDQVTPQHPTFNNGCLTSSGNAGSTVTVRNYHGGEAAVSEDDHATGTVLHVPGQTLSGYPSDVYKIEDPKNNWESAPQSTDFAGRCATVAVSPNGTTYKFGRSVRRHASNMQIPVTYRRRQGAGDYYTNHEALLEVLRFHYVYLVTEVIDVNGNWVRYNYTNDDRAELTQITSNENHQIDVTYESAVPDERFRNSRRIIQVKANHRVWDYSYYAIASPNIRGNLDKVTLPDGRFWHFGGEYLGMSKLSLNVHQNFYCLPYEVSVSFKHPNGAIGKFDLRETRHLKSSSRWFNNDFEIRAMDIPVATNDNLCHSGNPSNSLRAWERPIGWPVYQAMSVKSKTISGADIPTATWSHDYRDYSGGQIDTTWSEIVDPEGNRTKRTYYSVNPAHGLLKSVETDPIVGVSDTTTFEYDLPQGPFDGGCIAGYSDSSPAGACEVFDHRPVTKSEQIRGSDVFIRESTFFKTNGEYQDFGKPNIVSVRSNISGSTAPKITEYEYKHLPNLNIIGLLETVSKNGRVFVENTYNSLGQKTAVDRYQVRVADYAYNSDGTLSSVTDAIGRITQALDWKRGTPERIIRPDGFSTYQYVDDNGWVTSTRNARGATTSYLYDEMGRPIQVTPDQSERQWTPTFIDYVFAPNATQTITKADAKTTIVYDSFNRPVNVAVEDTLNSSVTYTTTEYDALGRTIFKSYPSILSNPTHGIATTYDGLGRMLSSYPTLAPNEGTSYSYLSGNRRQVTDADGNRTTYYHMGYDGPGNGPVRRILQPMGVNTYLTYDDWDQLLQVRQVGTNNGIYKSESQFFSYDAQGRRCRYYTDEGGQTNYEYDAAGQITAYAKGQPKTSSCTAPTSLSRVNLTYDDLGQVTKMDFADPGTPDIDYRYYRDGNLYWVKRDGVNWQYRFDKVGNPTFEQLYVDGVSYKTRYTYNDAGHLISREYPGLQVIDYDLDGLGRLKDLSYDHDGNTHDLATGMSYHASGAIDAFTYGNGYIFGQTLDARLRPTRLMAINGTDIALDQSLTYTTRGQVNTVTDLADTSGALGNDRSYVYDPLGRLTQAFGPWDTLDYTYDALGNLRTKTQTSSALNRTIINSYNSKNLLTQSDDSLLGNRAVMHDGRGNVTQLGGLSFVYDNSDQPIQVSGDVSGSYLYDGNLKRVRVIADGKTLYNVYDSSGRLIHVHDRASSKRTNYIHAGGQMIARLEKTGSQAPVARYQYTDLLGSPVAGHRDDGTLWRERYTPYGEKMLKPTELDNHASFTGHIDDSETGLTYMQARYYDPNIGRFLSIDPVTFMNKPYPGQFNRYAYTWNDPINANDPDGEFINFIIGAAIGAAIETGSQLIANGGDFSALDAGAIGKSAAIGSLTGGVGGALGKAALTKAAPRVAAKANTAFGSVKASAASGALEGGIGAGIGDVANQLTDGQAGVNLGQTASAVGQGAALGAISGGAGQVGTNASVKAQGLVEPTAANLMKPGLAGPFPGKGSGATGGAAAGATVATGTGIATERLDENR